MSRSSAFDTVRVVGGLLPSGLLERVGAEDPSLEAAKAGDYYLASGERLGEAITRSWNRLRTLWEQFSKRLEEGGALTGPTRQEWLLPLFQELGYGHLGTAAGLAVDGKAYPISHLTGAVPVHLVGVGVSLDRRTPGVAGAASASPHGLVQEFLNRSEDHLWGIVSNGRELRLLRDNASLTRTAYVEFELSEMFDGDLFSDFALLWLIAHASRLEGPVGKQVLERWREDANRQGVRALDALRDGVENAITTLGSAAVGHPANQGLRRRLDDNSLEAQDLYRQILRVVYRLLFLLVAEARGLLFDPSADQTARSRYLNYYSVTRLRDVAEATRGGPHPDLWRQFGVVARALGSAGEPALGLPGLGGFLWSAEATSVLDDATISNEALLSAIRSLTMVRHTGEITRRVDYANLGAEELGSIYESLLEYVPEVNLVAGTFELKGAAGNERKTTGSYYTPTSLINELLNSALDPVLEAAASKPDPEHAILDLNVVDPAAGSGHFLIAAAHRIAGRLAVVRAGGDEPSPQQLRAALRDVIGHCIYAVDLNPMAVELAKVALWIEAMEPGKPLTFLDHHIVCGNSLLGVTPKLLEEGIPDKAFVALTGDDKELVKALKARNRNEREKGLIALTFGDTPEVLLRRAAEELAAIDRLDDTTVEAIAEKQRRYGRLIESAEQRRLRLAADAWVAAFVGPKTKSSPQITTAVVNATLNDPNTVPTGLIADIAEIAHCFRFHHWHLAFPHLFTSGTVEDKTTGWSGGFDVVLGNPPWERVKLQEKEFFATSAPEIATAANKAARQRLIKQLIEGQPGLWEAFQVAVHDSEAMSQFLRASGVYPLCGRGDVNTYTVFAEMMRSVVNRTGRAGVIVPTGIATDDTTKHFFADLVDQKSLVSLFDFENRKAIFLGVHRSYKFCLLTLAGADCPVDEAEFCFFALDASDLSEPERRFTLTADDFALLNPNTRTCPIFRTKRDAEITKGIYRRVPVLVNETKEDGNPWGVTFQRMFDMSNDSQLFRTRDHLEADGWTLEGNVFNRDDERHLPLYEAKMIHHFNHRWATYDGDEIRDSTRTELAVPGFAAIARYWVNQLDVKSAMRNPYAQWLLGFRRIARSTDERTFIACFLPPVAAGDSVFLVWSESTVAWTLGALFSSLAFDYIARQKQGGTNANFFLVEQLPLPSPKTIRTRVLWSTDTLVEWIRPHVLELAYVADDLAGIGVTLDYQGAPFQWDPLRRSLLCAELDAAVFHLYGIEREDVDYIMETFPIVKRKNAAEHGSYRTKDLILDVYDRMAKAIGTGELYQTILDPPAADPSLCHPAGVEF